MANQKPQLNSFALDTREDLVINAIEIFDTIKQSLIVLDKKIIGCHGKCVVLQDV